MSNRNSKLEWYHLKEYIQEHGIDEALRTGNMDWEHIFDSEFHKIKEYYVLHANLIDHFIETRLAKDRRDV